MDSECCWWHTSTHLKAMAAEAEALELTATSNPYLAFYRQFCAEHPGELTAVFDPELSDERRSEMYAALDVSVAMVRTQSSKLPSD
ncbi:hypothetical protein BBJ28_00005945 [Nothophytophthora sp. Chile5]|nr:hypothetical protein BBJ28_00005945 [Nothophytophthora sp. Chile5]